MKNIKQIAQCFIHNVDFWASIIAVGWSVLSVTVLPQLQTLVNTSIAFGFATAAMTRALHAVKKTDA